MKKRSLRLFTVLIIVLMAAYFSVVSHGFRAENKDYSVLTKAIDNDIHIDEFAMFELIIENKQDFDDRFFIALEDIRWSLLLDPITDYTMGIDASKGRNASTKMILVPNEELRIGEYNLRIDATSKETGEIVSGILSVYIAPEMGDLLHADLELKMDADGDIDPRDPIIIRTTIDNKNEMNHHNITVELKSSLFSDTRIIDIGPYETKNVQFEVNLDKKESPRSAMVIVSLIDGEKTISVAKQEVQIIRYSPGFYKTKDEEDRFLKKINTINVENVGNTINTENIKEETTWFKSFFMNSKPVHHIAKENGRRYLSWNIELRPDETTKITFTESYRELFYMFIIALGAVIAYYIFRNPIIVTKKSKVIQKHDGGIHILKVYIDIQNRSNRTYKDVRLIDLIPKMVEHIKEKNLGTLEPNKIIAKGPHKLLEYRIPQIDPKEHRIISYRIKSNLSILGDLILKKAQVNYHTEGGKLKKSYSNEFFVEHNEKV